VPETRLPSEFEVQSAQQLAQVAAALSPLIGTALAQTFTQQASQKAQQRMQGLTQLLQIGFEQAQRGEIVSPEQVKHLPKEMQQALLDVSLGHRATAGFRARSAIDQLVRLANVFPEAEQPGVSATVQGPPTPQEALQPAHVDIMQARERARRTAGTLEEAMETMPLSTVMAVGPQAVTAATGVAREAREALKLRTETARAQEKKLVDLQADLAKVGQEAIPLSAEQFSAVLGEGPPAGYTLHQFGTSGILVSRANPFHEPTELKLALATTDTARTVDERQRAERALAVVRHGRRTFGTDFNESMAELFGPEVDIGTLDKAQIAQINRLADQRTIKRLAAQGQNAAQIALTMQEGTSLVFLPQEVGRQFYHKSTAEQVDQKRKRSEVVADPDVAAVSKGDGDRLDGYNQLRQDLGVIMPGLFRIYGPGGIFDNLPPGILKRGTAAIRGYLATLAQTDEVLIETKRALNALVERFGRAATGSVGVQTERDAARFRDLLADLNGFPDTKAVAFGTMTTLLDLTVANTRRILKSESFRDPVLDKIQEELQKLDPVAFARAKAKK